MREEQRKRQKRETIRCFETAIIAGDLKGKKILIPDIKTTRSSKAILRESLFNTLQFDIIDKGFVEVFAGSGSVGLEALSRGAGEAFFIERDRTVYDVLRHNIKTLEVTNANTILGDSFEEFNSAYQSIKRSGVKAYFYFDPPFSIRDDMDDIYDKTIDLISKIEPDVCEMVIIEHMTSLDLPKTIGSLIQSKRKKFGKSSLSYYTTKDV